MGERLFEFVQTLFEHWGYWTVMVVLLLENAGMPVPGETVLLFASFLAYSEGELRLPYIILIAIAACTFGDNLGYFIGHRGGRPLLERYQHIFHISNATISRGERLFARHGSVTIFFARFIFGMRIVAGPLAGVLNMPWRQFVLYNLLGATVWVTVISLVGYFFGSEWDTLVKVMGKVNLVVALIFVLLLTILVRRYWARKECDPQP
ncbi:MAG: DedA family protein [Acidobacteriaceae bacterium]|nr:DedA family protein [Acidobacteriaceae bacterium]